MVCETEKPDVDEVAEATGPNEGEVAELEPTELLAIATTRSVEPTSALCAV